jgi:hypothetical protein
MCKVGALALLYGLAIILCYSFAAMHKCATNDVLHCPFLVRLPLQHHVPFTSLNITTIQRVDDMASGGAAGAYMHDVLATNVSFRAKGRGQDWWHGVLENQHHSYQRLAFSRWLIW